MFQQTRNKILFLALVVPTLVAVLGGQARAQAANKALPVDRIGQETNQWCWAAGTQMTTKFAGVAVKQCDQANARFTRNDCCVSPTPAACIQPGWPEFPKWGFNTDITGWGVALTWVQLKAQIDNNHPVAYSWGWTGGGGHLMVAIAYQYWAADDIWILINDPLPVGAGSSRWITYNEFVAAAGDHVHWQDYYNTIKRP
jgi:hypothetical protein